MSWPLRRRLALLSLMVVLAVPALAACSSPSIDVAGCDVALIVTMETLDAHLTSDGALRHGRAHERADGNVFVSAELLPADEGENHDGDILTWFTEDPAGSSFVSVDEHARDHSDWPAAEFNVDEEGAVTSRGCVLAVRGAPPEDECDELAGEGC